MKGHINLPCLEVATDNTGVWEDRLLGVSKALVLSNEMEFSITPNNATWEPDIERRCRRISLFLTPDNVNGHKYRHPLLDLWIKRHRDDLLSAVNAMVSHWVRQGCPHGPLAFSSFPEWGHIVGGIFHACGLSDPCQPNEESVTSGDQFTHAMREFFKLAMQHFGDRSVPKQEFQEFLQRDECVHNIFEWIDFAARRGMISFGKLLVKFDKRELGGVTLDEDQATDIRQAFFRTYSRLRQWHGISHNQAEAGVTEVRTRTGRRRLVPEKASEWERFTALVNTPVQGGTADGMKHALILIHERLPKSARIVSTVHDEVVVECHEESADECREIITISMVEAMAALFPEVPVEVEANICTTWAEK